MTRTSVADPVSVDLKALLRALKLGKLLDVTDVLHRGAAVQACRGSGRCPAAASFALTRSRRLPTSMIHLPSASIRS